MAQADELDRGSVGRNGAARFSSIASIVFLIPTIVILISNGCAMSPWAKPFFKANPDHALTFFMGLIFEITFLCLPFNFLASLIVILAGVRGLRFADRSRTGAGRTESVLGISLALLVMVLSFAGFFQWGSAFRQ